MVRRTPRIGLIVCFALASARLAGPALADEGETALSLGLGYASFAIPDHEPPGATLAFDYEYGLGEELWLRGSAQAAGYSVDAGWAYGGQASLGLTYVIDVIKYVPYLHAGVGAAALTGEEIDNQLHPFVELGAGLDILVRRGLSYGLFARTGSFIDDSLFLSLGARVTWRRGFF